MEIEIEKDMSLSKFLRDVGLGKKTAGHMVEADDAQGGFLVGEGFEPEILGYGFEGSIVRPRAKIWNMKEEKVSGPRYVETDRSSGTFYGGIEYHWMKELADKADVVSKPALGQIELVAHKLIATTWVSNELIADAQNFNTFVKKTLIPGASFIQDQNFIAGDGVDKPLGILNANALIPVPRWTAGQVNMIDLGRMALRLTPESWASGTACWIFSQQVLEQIFELTATVANVGATYMLNDRQLFGLPIFVSSTASALGILGDVILADFSYYCIGDRSVEVAASEHQDSGVDELGWKTDETMYRLVIRVDGQPIVNAPIIPANGGQTVSPFVALTTPSS